MLLNGTAKNVTGGKQSSERSLREVMMLAESRVVPSSADGESGASYSRLGLHLLTAASSCLYPADRVPLAFAIGSKVG
jgi:hypothetical protein